jgi:hypothetical protein
MAVNETRSLNVDLRKGLTDGSVKKAAPDRGGVVEYDPVERNANLHRDLYDPSLSVEGELASSHLRVTTL